MIPVKSATVVDSRNLIGDASNHSISKDTFSVAGIRAAMADYGFDVGELSVGLAIVPGKKNPGSFLSAVHSRNAGLVNSLRAEGASVLIGELRHEDNRLTEKMVDTLCALELVKHAERGMSDTCQSILLFSRDLDLFPAAQFATARGAPVYIVSGDSQYLRHQHHILLTRSSYEVIFGGDSVETSGDQVARFLADPGPHTWALGESTKVQGRKGRHLTSSSGVRGFVDESEVGASTETMTLFAADVIFENNVPMVFCTANDKIDLDRPWLVTTRVLRRKDESLVEVDLGGVPSKTRCRVGMAERGQNVLVRVASTAAPVSQQANTRFIGALEVRCRARDLGRA